MFKTIVFVHKKYESLEVFINKEEKVILFDENDIRNRFKIYDEDIVITSGNYSGMLEICDLYECIKYSDVDDEIRWDYEEWLQEIILDCAKLI